MISTDAPDGLREDNVVKVTGSVTMLEESGFEVHFGVPADDVLEDPDGFFEDTDGQVALSASQHAIVVDDA